MNYRPSFTPRLPLVVKNLLIINALFYVATLTFNEEFMYRTFGAFYFASPLFDVWQPITYMFMHSSANFFHIFFNMYAVFMFGSAVESVWGPKRFLQYYMFTGIGALVLHMAVNAFQIYQLTGSIAPQANIPPEVIQIYSGPIVGASGAVFGLLLAFGMMFPNVELMLIFLPIPIKAKYFVILYGLIELFLGVARFQGDNIAHFAHIGGMLFGYILIRIWNRGKPRRFY